PAAAAALGAHTIVSAAGLPVVQGVVARSLAQQGHRSDIRAVAVSSDGAFALTSGLGAAKVWNVKTGSCVRTLELGAEETGLAVAFG
ncbi:hypothetical protein OFC62_37930, partial [Escherichia coli]|nr:hypothetical protein [Escherichia coli]